jgi:hypothetical protein
MRPRHTARSAAAISCALPPRWTVAGGVALVGVYLAPFSEIAFLWFIAVVRNPIGEREDRFFATVFLGSGLLFVAMLCVSAGVGGALLAAVRFQDEPVPSAETVVTIRSLACGWPPCS